MGKIADVAMRETQFPVNGAYSLACRLW